MEKLIRRNYVFFRITGNFSENKIGNKEPFLGIRLGLLDQFGLDKLQLTQA